jgi:multimeric flavodoxin WrbA
MKILALNATYRPAQTTTQLARKALEGAASVGAETEMVLLRERRIEYCTNCLACYRDLESEIPACPLKDEMDDLLAKVRDADGILFASPVHNGFVTGLLTVFFERLAWRVMRPSGTFLGMAMGMRSRLASKTRALAAILNPGGMPQRLRRFCDDGTPWLKSNAPLMLHGQWVGDMYAGAVLTRVPQTEADWNGIYGLRRLAPEQLDEAFRLGVRLAEAAGSGMLRPVTLDTMTGPISKVVFGFISRFRRPYPTLPVSRP